MRFHSYVDESIRGNSYFLAEIRVKQRDVGWLRSHVIKNFGHKGQLMHMHQESSAVRNQAIDALIKLPITVNIIWAVNTKNNSLGRSEALNGLASQADVTSCNLLTLENISNSYADRKLLSEIAKRSPGDFPVFRHLTKSEEPILVLADIAAWSFGRSGPWRIKLAPVLSKVIEI